MFDIERLRAESKRIIDLFQYRQERLFIPKSRVLHTKSILKDQFWFIKFWIDHLQWVKKISDRSEMQLKKTRKMWGKKGTQTVFNDAFADINDRLVN